MSVTLPLDQMTTAEKLQAMEDLWADLTRNEQGFESPSWHEAAGVARQQRDWEIAKKELRDTPT